MKWRWHYLYTNNNKLVIPVASLNYTISRHWCMWYVHVYIISACPMAARTYQMTANNKRPAPQQKRSPMLYHHLMRCLDRFVFCVNKSQELPLLYNVLLKQSPKATSQLSYNILFRLVWNMTHSAVCHVHCTLYIRSKCYELKIVRYDKSNIICTMACQCYEW